MTRLTKGALQEGDTVSPRGFGSTPFSPLARASTMLVGGLGEEPARAQQPSHSRGTDRLRSPPLMAIIVVCLLRSRCSLLPCCSPCCCGRLLLHGSVDRRLGADRLLRNEAFSKALQSLLSYGPYSPMQ